MTDAPRRFITRSYRIKRTTWVLAVTLTMAAAVSLTLAARNGSQGFSAAFISAVNSADVRIVPAGQTAAVTVTEKSAVAAALAELPPGSSASAADLVTLTNSQYPGGMLAWAIETIPAGGYSGFSCGPPPRRGTAGPHHCQPPRQNFRVDFVDASTGAWLEGVSGYSSGL